MNGPRRARRKENMDTIPLCHSLQTILTGEDELPLYAARPAGFAAALAPDGATCTRWAEQLSPLPVGLPLVCPPAPDPDAIERPVTLRYIEDCKRAFRPLLHDDAAFYYVCGAETFATLRAAVLALTDLTGRTVIAELEATSDEGRLADGTEVRAAVGVLQRIGVTTVILRADRPEALSEALTETAPYARLSLGACVRAQWLRDGLRLPSVELLLPVPGESGEALLALIGEPPAVPRDHDDFIIAPDGTNAHFIDPTIDISDEIECGHRLGEALIEAEDDAGALKLVLESEEDVVALEEHRYMISRPVCLCAESAELLEQGLRVYPGLALYDGTWEQPEEVLHYLEHKYGLIRL